MIYKNYILKIHYSIFIAMAAQANASARTRYCCKIFHNMGY